MEAINSILDPRVQTERDREIDAFLAKVDEVDRQVRGLFDGSIHPDDIKDPPKSEPPKKPDPPKAPLNPQEAMMMAMKADADERQARRQAAIKRADVIKDKGNVAFGKGLLEEALKLYTEGLEELHTHVTLLLNRSLVYLKLGRAKEAFVDSNKALMIEQTNAKAFVRRSHANQQLGQFADALSDMKSALVNLPSNSAERSTLEARCTELTAILKQLETDAALALSVKEGADDISSRLTVLRQSGGPAAIQVLGQLKQLLHTDARQALFRQQGGVDLLLAMLKSEHENGTGDSPLSLALFSCLVTVCLDAGNVRQLVWISGATFILSRVATSSSVDGLRVVANCAAVESFRTLCLYDSDFIASVMLTGSTATASVATQSAVCQLLKECSRDVLGRKCMLKLSRLFPFLESVLRLPADSALVAREHATGCLALLVLEESVRKQCLEGARVSLNLVVSLLPPDKPTYETRHRSCTAERTSYICFLDHAMVFLHNLSFQDTTSAGESTVELLYGMNVLPRVVAVFGDVGSPLGERAVAVLARMSKFEPALLEMLTVHSLLPRLVDLLTAANLEAEEQEGLVCASHVIKLLTLFVQTDATYVSVLRDCKGGLQGVGKCLHSASVVLSANAALCLAKCAETDAESLEEFIEPLVNILHLKRGVLQKNAAMVLARLSKISRFRGKLEELHALEMMRCYLDPGSIK